MKMIFRFYVIMQAIFKRKMPVTVSFAAVAFRSKNDCLSSNFVYSQKSWEHY